MTADRKKKLLRAVELADKMDEREVDIAKMFATAMQAGYDLGKLQAQTA
ncbi:MAG: hypothetical protein VB104_04155 [Candidatus Limiplasma sp.]|nr:hypothetical protein [Candidatus Limiplasma sp.]